ncbi:MAG: efflux RND transporter periplasmic adaptor subunit [Flavobacteriales bacterium]|jgi:HlyD family secretion protein|nr:efflux RND transporter periplasmic adaptor subunit [Flavobacteriales bacterium]
MKKFIIIALVLILGFVVYKVLTSETKKKGKKVHVEQVLQGNILETVSASGKIQPEKEVKLSPDVSGEIIELTVLEGQKVKKGDFLLKIKPDLYESVLSKTKANLSSTISNLESAKSRYKLSKAEYERSKELFGKNIVSQSEFDNVKANYEQAKLNVDGLKHQVSSARATVKEAQENLGFTKIYSPVDGTISKLNVEKGERVVGTGQMSGTEIMKIADLNSMEVLVEVGEADIMKLKIGNPCKIEVDAYYSKTFTGTVTEIASSAKGNMSLDQVSTFEVKVRIDKESYQSQGVNFKPGMSASLEIQTKKIENKIKVPIQAVTMRVDSANIQELEKQGLEPEMKEVVFVYQDGKALQKEVKTGIQDEKHIEVVSGLNANEWVVTAPYKEISKKLKTGTELDTVPLSKLFN